jgi:hypothetical protein
LLNKRTSLTKNKLSSNQEKYAAKLIRMQLKIKEGLISERFPEVSKIVIRMIYSEKNNKVSMIRTVYFPPTDYAYFNMECLTKKCVDGGFDLSSEIAHLVENHMAFGKGKMFCSTKHCPATVNYEINIYYKKRAAEFLTK